MKQGRQTNARQDLKRSLTMPKEERKKLYTWLLLLACVFGLAAVLDQFQSVQDFARENYAVAGGLIFFGGLLLVVIIKFIVYRIRSKGRN